jgi:hypothetical protein
VILHAACSLSPLSQSYPDIAACTYMLGSVESLAGKHVITGRRIAYTMLTNQANSFSTISVCSSHGQHGHASAIWYRRLLSCAGQPILQRAQCLKHKCPLLPGVSPRQCRRGQHDCQCLYLTCSASLCQSGHATCQAEAAVTWSEPEVDQHQQGCVYLHLAEQVANAIHIFRQAKAAL